MASLGDDDSSANIQVVVRVRPMNEREKKDKTLPVVTASFEKSEVRMDARSCWLKCWIYSVRPVADSCTNRPQLFE